MEDSKDGSGYRSFSFTYSCRSATLLYAGRMILTIIGQLLDAVGAPTHDTGHGENGSIELQG